MVAYVLVIKLTTWPGIRWTRTLRPLLIMNFSDGSHVSDNYLKKLLLVKKLLPVST